MIYQLDFSFRAEADAGIAGSEYDKKLPGLSFRFFDELNFFILAITKNPFAFHIYQYNPAVRRCNLRRFAYAIYYTIDGDTIKILAIIHEQRSKRYIKRRLK